jgi:hypothetical protein
MWLGLLLMFFVFLIFLHLICFGKKKTYVYLFFFFCKFDLLYVLVFHFGLFFRLN